jgi:hypothetical protein
MYAASGKWSLASLLTAAAITPVQPFIGIIAFANAIPDMRALSVLSLESNYLYAEGGKALADGLKVNRVITELNISDNHLGKSGRSGRIDISGIIALADVIPDMGALSVLNLAENYLGELVLPEGWTEDHDEILPSYPHQRRRFVVYKHADGREQMGNPGKPEGIIAIANAIPDMGAMTSLNIFGNRLGVEGARHVAVGLRVSKRVVAVVLVPCSCPSDHWLNCCCLLLSTGYEGNISHYKRGPC